MEQKKRTIAETIQAKGVRIGILGILVGVFVWFWPIFERKILWDVVGLLPTGPKIIAYSLILIALAVLLRIMIPFVWGILTD